MGCILDTATVDLDTTGGVLTANVKVSADAGNALSAHADGLYSIPGFPSGLGPLPYSGTVLPSGWLFCDGAAVSRSTYSDLFAAIGTSFGAGDGLTTFNLPDIRGRVPVGHAAAGGHVDVATLGLNDGVALANRRAKHNHHAKQVASGLDVGLVGFQGGGGTSAAGMNNTGNTAVYDIVVGPDNGVNPQDAPAYLVVNYIIKT